MKMNNGMSGIHPVWCIAENGFDIEKNKHYEGLFTQGNGYLSVRGSLEEGLASAPQDEEYMRRPASVTVEKQNCTLSKFGTYIPGIVGRHPLLNDVIINLPYFFDFRLWSGGELLDMEHSVISDYRRWLDFRDGTLNRELVWNQEGASLKVCFRRFISMESKSLSVQQVSVKLLSGRVDLRIETGIDGRVRTNGYNHLTGLSAFRPEERIAALKATTDKGNEVLFAVAVGGDLKEEMEIETKKDGVIWKAERTMEAGEELYFEKYIGAATDRDIPLTELGGSLSGLMKKAGSEGFAGLYCKHRAVWDEKWRTSDIKIEGDDDFQLAIRFAIYHLIRSNSEKDPAVAICAKGYAGEAYFGRYFWDTEIYMLPFFIYTNPEAVGNLLRYRYNTLNGARRNASRYGCRGARYAWESALSGDEQCALWQYADNEVHVSADIPYAIWHYYKATGDSEFMRNYGLEILAETSRYWMERIDVKKDGTCDLVDVMGPDEYKPFSLNNAFTNRMVIHTLQKTLELLEDSGDCLSGQAAHRLHIQQRERETFRTIAQNLPVPWDREKDLILQSEDFYKYADIDMDSCWKDKSQVFGHFVSQERLYRSKALKQADALALISLFPDEFTLEQIRKAYEYYEPITTHDSSLSPVVHALIACWLGKEEDVRKYTARAIRVDFSPDERGGARDGIHIANCGGLWQLVVFGFAGLKSAVWSREPVLNPHLPKHWESLEFRIVFQGEIYRIRITQDNCSCTKEV